MHLSALPPMIRLAYWVYLPMIGMAGLVLAPGGFGFSDPLGLAIGMGVALLIGLLVAGLSRWVARRTGWGRALRIEFQGLLKEVDSQQVLVLALLSGFGEEILFRGVLQPRLGWFWATLLFGALHFPIRRTLLPWSLFALVMGLVLAGMTEFFQTLWPAILLHFIVNYLNLHDLALGKFEGNGGADAADEESRDA